MTAHYRPTHVDPLGRSWPRCKTPHCLRDAALGGVCKLHGGHNACGCKLALFLDWPEDGADFQVECMLPQRGAWQAWVVSALAFERLARDGLWPPRSANLRDLSPRARSYRPGSERAPQPVRAAAARRLLALGTISTIALVNQFTLANRLVPGLELPPEGVPAALARVRFAAPLSSAALEAMAPAVERACREVETQRRAFGLPVFPRESVVSHV